jgi:hypothetical protein
MEHLIKNILSGFTLLLGIVLVGMLDISIGALVIAGATLVIACFIYLGKTFGEWVIFVPLFLFLCYALGKIVHAYRED